MRAGSADLQSGGLPSASSLPAIAAASSSAVVRRCAEAGECATGNLAWCNAAGARVACCGEGLVGTLRGRCECPPGGSRNELAVKQGCSAADPEHPKKVQRVVRTNFKTFGECFDAAKKRHPQLGGAIAVRFLLAPDGSSYGQELRGVSIPDAVFQDCVIDHFATLRFPPPADGYVEIVYPIAFGE
jgi:hypothetical protein